ncbi:MAG TPA: phosphohistidine phosphatase SixA [Candidatus Competibacteraceae bacterium]|nr:phosphohistidine phosphatase SixA [Candidatus Competibacteraceae bacterium]
MQLLLIRHGIAEDAELFARAGGRDEDRPLTEAGLRKMRRIAQGLSLQAEDLERLYASRLVRARQTAELVAAAYGGLPIEERAELSPYGELPPLLDWLATLPPQGVVAVVGHEPQLSRLCGLLLCGEAHSLLRLKKGAAVLIDFPAAPAAGAGVLHWALTPRQLRALGG